MAISKTQTVDTTERLAALRVLMSNPDSSVGALFVPSEDQRKYHFIVKV
jgi:hypothetical protein